MKRRTLLVGSLGVLAIPALAKAYFDTGTFNNVAVSGYDPVAYFTQGKAVEGDKKYSTRYKEAEFRFSSQAHLDAFVAEPEKYAPQYGGYCAMPWQTVIRPAPIPRLFQWSMTSYLN